MMHQTFNEKSNQRVSGNVERPEHLPLNLARLTGVFLLFASVGWIVCVGLENIFGTVGDTAENHAAVGIAAYYQHTLVITLSYYGSMLVGFLFIALAPLLSLTVARSHTPLEPMAATFQVLAGLIQALAASRWVIILPMFAHIYTDPQTSTATQVAIGVTYQAIMYVFGIMLGEHFNYVFTGSWCLLLSISLLRTPGGKRWLGWLGVVAGTLLLLGSFEQFDFAFASSFLPILSGGILIRVVWAITLAFRLLTNKDTILEANARRENLTNVVS